MADNWQAIIVELSEHCIITIAYYVVFTDSSTEVEVQADIHSVDSDFPRYGLCLRIIPLVHTLLPYCGVSHSRHHTPHRL